MKTTRRLQWNEKDPEAQRAVVAEAAGILRNGGTVALPTETVYGLGANALDAVAVESIFAAKQRPAWDPLIVHIADRSQVDHLAAAVSPAASAWIEAFWPGPLTLLVPRSPAIPDAVTAGSSRVGVRMPGHPAMLAVLRAAGVPVAAPSANRFGHVSPTTAEHVLQDLDGRIDAVLDAGPCAHGVESTVVDTTITPCRIYRPGVVTLEQLRAVWPDVETHTSADRKAGDTSPLPSPGFGLRHYAPAAQLELIEHSAQQAETFAREIAERREGSLGVLLPEGLLAAPLPKRAGLVVYPWGTWGQAETLAHSLFEGLRTLDAAGVSRILCPAPSLEGLGAAICDRLRKAAMKRE